MYTLHSSRMMLSVCVAAVETHLILHSQCCYTFCLFEIMDINTLILNRVYHVELVLEGVSSVAYFMTTH